MPKKKNDIDIVNSEQDQTKTAESIEKYWTDDVMMQARPIEPEIDEKQLVELMNASIWTQEGSQTVMESQPPDKSSVSDHEKIVDIANSFSTTRLPKSDQDDLPYCTIGKMFMTFDNEDFVGTGWVVAEKAVFTAGHCVFDHQRGGWADNILFIPQHSNLESPVGKWTSNSKYTLWGWAQNEKFEYDMAAFVTDRLIRPDTGSLGWMANYAPNQGPYKAIGYPAEPVPGYNFNGKNMWQSVGGYIGGKNPIQIHNNMTGGCSGGPWVVTRNRNVYANGLNSFRYRNQPGTMYSPYFGNGFLNLYNAVEGIR